MSGISAQGGAYATGVLVLMSSAGVATVIGRWRERRGLWLWRVPWGYVLITAVFLYTTMYIQALPDFTYDPEKWSHMAFVVAQKGDAPSWVGFIFSDAAYAASVFKLFRSPAAAADPQQAADGGPHHLLQVRIGADLKQQQR